MIIKQITDLELFAQKAEQHIGIFGSKQWLSVYGDKLKLIGIYKDEHQLIGGFYFLETKKYGALFIKLPPYTPHCGLFFVNDSKNNASQLNHDKEVMTAVCNYISDYKSKLCILAFPSNIVDFQSFIWSGYKVIPNYTYRIPLEKSMEEIIANFDSKNRNAINKAIKEQVMVIENGLNQQDLFQFFFKQLKTVGANVYEKELKRIMCEFSNTSNSFSFIAKQGDNILGAVFCIYDNVNCYYMLGGVEKKSGVQGINNLLIQKSIEKAKTLGCKTFDFEGSMLKGVEKFFRSFGPDLVPYFTVNKANLPLEILLKFKKRSIF